MQSPRILKRSNLEAYVSIIIAIITVVFRMTWYFKILLLLVVAGLITDISFHAPFLVQCSRKINVMICLVCLSILFAIGWNQVIKEYHQSIMRQEAKPENEKQTAEKIQAPMVVVKAKLTGRISW